jgi:hypothetical protein
MPCVLIPFLQLRRKQLQRRTPLLKPHSACPLGFRSCGTFMPKEQYRVQIPLRCVACHPSLACWPVCLRPPTQPCGPASHSCTNDTSRAYSHRTRQNSSCGPIRRCGPRVLLVRARRRHSIFGACQRCRRMRAIRTRANTTADEAVCAADTSRSRACCCRRRRARSFLRVRSPAVLSAHGCALFATAGFGHTAEVLRSFTLWLQASRRWTLG